ncbi:histidine kinase dimerization/phospho-acceptor domain-containing protein [Brevibacillus sp. B_LB10_24]|uniref:sensor histidine kinase n=1 Tax=Brevibacillus sp. B_LB10_24 TaxID=3380645 RepID=UPI0038B6C607
MSDHDNLLLLWLPLDYTWALKVKLLAYIWQSCFMLLLVRNLSRHAAGTGLFRGYMAFLSLYSAFLFIAPAPLIYYTTEVKVFELLYLFPLAWVFYLVGRMVVRNHSDAVFLLFAATSVFSSIFWGVLQNILEVDNIYYPIDVIGAIVGFSAYWFKRYFRNSEENAKLNEQLRQADKLKDQFLANTSHELRTPLHGIINIAQTVVANEKQAMNARSTRDMELLITISWMSRLIDDLLDVVRLQDKRIVLHKEPLHVQSVVSGVIDTLTFMIDVKPIQLKMEIPDPQQAG